MCLETKNDLFPNSLKCFPVKWRISLSFCFPGNSVELKKFHVMKEKEKRKWRAYQRVCALFKDDYFSLDINNITDIVPKVYATEFPTVTCQEGWVLEQIEKRTPI